MVRCVVAGAGCRCLGAVHLGLHDALEGGFLHTHRGDSGQHPWPLTHQMPGAQPLQVVKSQMPSDLAQRAPGGNNHPGPGPGRSLAALQRTRPCGKILPCPWNPRFVPRHRRGQAHAGIDTHSHTEVTLCFSRPAWAHTQMSFRGGTGAMEGGVRVPSLSPGGPAHTPHTLLLRILPLGSPAFP